MRVCAWSDGTCVRNTNRNNFAGCLTKLRRGFMVVSFREQAEQKELKKWVCLARTIRLPAKAAISPAADRPGCLIAIPDGCRGRCRVLDEAARQAARGFVC